MNRSPAQWFCLVGGAFLLVRGAVGVALDPVFESPGEGWHQLFHLTSGALLLAAARRARPALAFTLAFATVYGAVAVTGLVDGHDVAGVIPIETSDNAVHVVLTTAALVAGLLALARGPRAAATSP